MGQDDYAHDMYAVRPYRTIDELIEGTCFQNSCQCNECGAWGYERIGQSKMLGFHSGAQWFERAKCKECGNVYSFSNANA